MTTPTPKIKKWLIEKKATPEEEKIYLLAMDVEQPFKNKDIRTLHRTSVTNIHGHLIRMITKGLIIRYSYQSYRVSGP